MGDLQLNVFVDDNLECLQYLPESARPVLFLNSSHRPVPSGYPWDFAYGWKDLSEHFARWKPAAVRESSGSDTDSSSAAYPEERIVWSPELAAHLLP
eukprot:NODE_2995_length_510_cov_115.917570_g2592_i0.p1 GENE.NODE_2995_length_510_cov_115.917570_g2592_i0~~NODE_2995_length_510_cov_115.917570_g2592_i0.p1  ORF type:complete len:107 (-),score=13.58 NODE_2995_length_510_cov_115.917570_g2592_i0:188-478(-)